MRTKLHKSKEESRAAIEQEIAAITTDLERLRAIIRTATDNQEQTVEATPADHPQRDKVLLT
jgi:hypothetical protein